MLRKINFIILIIIFTIGLACNLTAQETQKGRISHSLTLQASSLPEAKLGYVFNYNLPFQLGNSRLTENNNINFAATAEISPISIIGHGSAVWTPVPFLEAAAGLRIGTGWNIKLFGSELYGLGLTHGSSLREVTSDIGFFSKVYFAGAFQFDLAAVFPGDWNHVIFKTYHEINNSNYSRATDDESWILENDDGENVNGFKYYANALIGYQMPVFLNMAGFLAEMDLNLYDISGKSAWGGNLPQWTFSAVLNFKFHEKFEVALLTQFRTRKNYTQSNWKDIYYRNLTIDNSNKLRLEFYRVAAMATYRL